MNRVTHNTTARAVNRPLANQLLDEENRSHARIGIYVGKGASHSWLWFVDTLEHERLKNLAFLSEDDIQNGGLHSLDALIVSGGDTFAIAEGLGPKGAESVEQFVHQGGLYIGSCAGAYLPLNSSKRHLRLFNYVDAKIANITKALPGISKLPPKSFTSYGCSFIFHPVRDEVAVRLTGIEPPGDVGTIIAPLYGGPAIIPSENFDVLACYTAFTSKTIFFLDREIGAEVFLGKAAAIKSRKGRGHFFLFGPHFEHPHYPKANELLGQIIRRYVRGDTAQEIPYTVDAEPLEKSEIKESIRSLKRHISDCRIMAIGLEMNPVRWQLGMKTYEPEKILVFLHAVWNRILVLERMADWKTSKTDYRKMLSYGSEISLLIRQIKRLLDREGETTPLAAYLFNIMKSFTGLFLTTYFNTLKDSARSKGIQCITRHKKRSFSM
jgi:glutamine amidotransferase-like uncharacterized protein